MKNSVNNYVSKAQALGLTSYIMFNTGYLCELSTSKNFVEVTIYVCTLGELISLESEISKFLVDGCSTELKYLEKGEIYTYDIMYPTTFQECQY